MINQSFFFETIKFDIEELKKNFIFLIFNFQKENIEKMDNEKELQKKSEIIDLNVGGKKFSTYRSTLMKYKNSVFGAMFSGRHEIQKDKEGNYFIDRDPKKFGIILDFFRNQIINEKIWEKHSIIEELSYYGIEIDLKKEIDDPQYQIIQNWNVIYFGGDGEWKNKTNCISSIDKYGGIKTSFPHSRVDIQFEKESFIKGFNIFHFNEDRWNASDLDGAKLSFYNLNGLLVDTIIIDNTDLQTQYFLKGKQKVKKVSIQKSVHLGLKKIEFF